MSGLTGKDVDRILALADTLRDGEIDLTTGETRIVIRAGAAPTAVSALASAERTIPKNGMAPPPAAIATAARTPDGPEGTPIISPLVGTFYRAPRPGDPPFVKPGDMVEPDTVIGIVELMKLMNSVTAGVAGEVVEIVAQDGATIQPGDTLMIVRPS